MNELPPPPIELADRAGQVVGRDGSFAAYEAVGAELMTAIARSVPEGWTWSGKRVLDFGCGAGARSGTSCARRRARSCGAAT